MRWPFRRKDADSTTESAPSAAPAEVRGAGAPRPPARQWASLPAIPVTITRSAPLVVGPAPVLPPLRPGRRSRSGPPVDVPLGSVTGLAHPAALIHEPKPAPPEPVALVAPAPVVHRPARPMPAEVPTFVNAVDEYVGEPREPAEPHRAPGFLRYAPTWLMPGEPMIPGLPGPEAPTGPPPSFLPKELQSPPELPPRMEEVISNDTDEIVSRPVRKRRANLGQSRRLGLGAPIAMPDGEALIHPEEPPRVVDGSVAPEPAPPARPEPPQEPPPPPAAPARQAAEPEPAPQAPAPQPEPPPRDPPPPPPSGGGGSTPQKRAVATVYRATAELRPAPRQRELPRATVVSAVPTELANAVRARQQADVSDVPVYRGPTVSAAARSRGARAFASGGAVFLPDEAGPADSQKARGLLAHELIHAVQQRTLGALLPTPDSAHGQELEAEAQAAERYYSGESGAAEPAPLIHAPMPTMTPAAEPDFAAAAQHADPLPAARTQTAAPAHSVFDAATRAEVGKIAEDSAKNVVAEWTNPKLTPKQGGGTEGGGTGGTGGTASAGGTTGAGAAKTPAAATSASSFNAGTYRHGLVAAALAMRNDALAPGQSSIGELSAEELSVIDRQVEAEAAKHGVAVESTGPAAQHYEANSAKGWMHALTGANMNYGTGITGFNEPVGSEKSWWGSKTGDKRPMEEKLLDGFGLMNEDTKTQFDTDTWFQEKPADAKDGGKTDATADGANKPAQHEDWLFGEKNPDKSTVDINKIDLDELANRLYDRVRSKLRLELLVDRERAGLLTDFR